MPQLNYHPRRHTHRDPAHSVLDPLTLGQSVGYLAFATLTFSLFLFSITWWWLEAR